MKLKYLIPLFVFILVKISFAEENSIYSGEFIENSQTYIFGDNVRVRKEPDAQKSNVIETLNIGDKITIQKKTDQTMIIDGYKSFWYKVSYKKNNKDSSGFIWGGMFSLGYAVKGDMLLLAGIKKFDENKGFIGECKLVKNNKIISSAGFEPHHLSMGDDIGVYGYSFTTELKDNKGLDGLKGVFRIFMDYGACGFPRGNIWIGYSDEKLYYIGKDTSISEAGVFQVNEKYIFPSDKKTDKDTVILVNESYEFNEKTEKYKLTKKQETKYKWKNFKLNPVK